MKTQESIHNMKHHFVWLLTILMLTGLLDMASISLAVEDTWTAKADMPTARGFLSTNSTVNGKIYAIGGAMGDEPPNLTVTSTVEEYDPVTDKWTKKADMPTPRLHHSTSVVNGKIYAIGGWVAPAGGPVLSTVEEYDPVTDKWTKKADLPTERCALCASVVNGKIYALGGWGYEVARQWFFLSAVEEYDTGFAIEANIEAKGKLATSWGKIKSD